MYLRSCEARARGYSLAMAKDPIIFACANPVPEIFPDEAKAAGAAGLFEGVKGFPYDGDVQGIWYCIQNTGAL